MTAPAQWREMKQTQISAFQSRRRYVLRRFIYPSLAFFAVALISLYFQRLQWIFYVAVFIGMVLNTLGIRASRCPKCGRSAFASFATEEDYNPDSCPHCFTQLK